MNRTLLAALVLAAAAPRAAASDMVAIPVYSETQYRATLLYITALRDKAVRLDAAEVRLADRLRDLKTSTRNIARLPVYFGERETYIRSTARPPIQRLANSLRASVQCFSAVRPQGGIYGVPTSCFDPASFDQAERFRPALQLWERQPLDKPYLLEVLPDSYAMSFPQGVIVRCSAATPPCRQHYNAVLDSLVSDWQAVIRQFKAEVPMVAVSH